MSAYKDAQAQNNISRNVRQYSDLDLFFGKRTVGSDVNKVTDIQAVKRSLRNLINLNTFEKPFHPEISGGVREMLFENMTPVTAQIIARKVIFNFYQLFFLNSDIQAFKYFISNLFINLFLTKNL